MQKQFWESSELQQRSRTRWSSEHKHGHPEVWGAFHLHPHPRLRAAQCRGSPSGAFYPMGREEQESLRKGSSLPRSFVAFTTEDPPSLHHSDPSYGAAGNPHCCVSLWELGPVAAVRPAPGGPNGCVPTLWAWPLGF